ncbi:DUF4363 family protein [Clostridium weizhouense]|uniref:DUF4363 family protein n=1 Tax=Clostridium weizhouense TaxID=2859781 RepID=A0ABS7AJ38_9CLOT|nr:DUF4363 family protein [Clostridium weizhouense]MBW6408678.1 DUF4363 family protein [Clostridium weizhouense]
MRKFLVITIPIVSLIFFIAIMLSTSILKKSLGTEISIPNSIQLIIEDVESGNWDAANEKTKSLSKTWEKIVKRIQFSSERDEINSFKSSIARLDGAIMAKDKSASLIQLKEAYDHWDGLGK